jgi:hypothetical protein
MLAIKVKSLNCRLDRARQLRVTLVAGDVDWRRLLLEFGVVLSP